MNDDRYLSSIKDKKIVGNESTTTVSIHPISKWLLRTILDNLYAEDDNQLMVDIGESVETLDITKYKQLQQDLVALGYPKEELCRGMFDEDSASENMCRCFKA